jgi:pimeloyl-ACP methyl ester carboxylesterase
MPRVLIWEVDVDDDRIHAAVSNDGTEIAGRVQGNGPPLVLVHGGLGDGEVSWFFMLPFLVEHFTCYLMSTRGRGLSAGSADHSRERQFEDVAAYVESIDEPAAMFGHSSGALWALGGAALSPAHVRALALYEPPFPALLPSTSDDQYTRIRAAVTDGRLADALQIATAEIIGLGAAEQALFSAPGVAERAQAALPMAVQELPELNRPFEDALLERLTMPVLVLQGERTRAEFKNAARLLAGRLEDARVAEIAGTGHVGPLTAPEPLAQELVGFFGR